MEVIDEHSDWFAPGPTAVTIGVYDGVHLGHRAVINRVRGIAGERDLPTVVVTFDRHPASVVRPESAPQMLTDLDQKLELLATTGVDFVLVIRFSTERASETAEDFVTSVLVDRLRARLVAVGEDFHFGKGRQGNVNLLARMGWRYRFDAVGLELVGTDGRPAPEGERVSSTAIRQALGGGDLLAANTGLGRHYEVRGVVTDGDRRGRELGFPTANVAVAPDIQWPAPGIYATWYERPSGAVLPGAAYIGARPTFYEDGAQVLEVHLLDWSGELYGERAKVRFVERIRDDAAFDSMEEFAVQLQLDCDDCRRVLAAEAGVGA